LRKKRMSCDWVLNWPVRARLSVWSSSHKVKLEGILIFGMVVL